ncbi:MAG TPA: PadR family transcriptional regulator [Acidimicrobiales bacterium]|nr:PadR family transcriptional regulator [Acidimicrobiales bacterium]
MGKKLGTTSYAILGLLALRDWTTYELAKQMERGVGDMWSAARSVVYAEPKELVVRGLATVRQEQAGRRPRAVYSITDEGRRTLAEWLVAPGRGPALEFEGLLKVLLAPDDDPAAPMSSIRAAAQWATDVQNVGRTVAGEYLAGEGPFPDRMPIVALTFAFLWDFTELVRGWAAWAEETVGGWSDEVSGSSARQPFLRALQGTTAIPPM